MRNVRKSKMTKFGRNIPWQDSAHHCALHGRLFRRQREIRLISSPLCKYNYIILTYSIITITFLLHLLKWCIDQLAYINRLRIVSASYAFVCEPIYVWICYTSIFITFHMILWNECREMIAISLVLDGKFMSWLLCDF
jgi:hypothetical protein